MAPSSVGASQSCRAAALNSRRGAACPQPYTAALYNVPCCPALQLPRRMGPGSVCGIHAHRRLCGVVPPQALPRGVHRGRYRRRRRGGAGPPPQGGTHERVVAGSAVPGCRPVRGAHWYCFRQRRTALPPSWGLPACDAGRAQVVSERASAARAALAPACVPCRSGAALCSTPAGHIPILCPSRRGARVERCRHQPPTPRPGPLQVFTSIGQLELFYDQAPDVMRSCSMALQLLSVCIGSYLSGAGAGVGWGWGGSTWVSKG